MSMGLGYQIQGYLTQQITSSWGETPWRENHRSNKLVKVGKHRRERRRAKADPECTVEYRRYHDSEY